MEPAYIEKFINYIRQALKNDYIFTREGRLYDGMDLEFYLSHMMASLIANRFRTNPLEIEKQSLEDSFADFLYHNVFETQGYAAHEPMQLRSNEDKVDKIRKYLQNIDKFWIKIEENKVTLNFGEEKGE